MKISMIAAMSSNRVIGKDNDLPWHLPDDFSYFKRTTKGHYVILGRKNYESLPPNFRPLPHRTNVIVTRNEAYEAAESTVIVHSVEDALKVAENAGEEEVFIIGGGMIYELGLKYADKIYLTEINGHVEGDTIFPEFDQTLWKETSRVHHPKDEKHLFSFDYVIYERSV